jgi:hypothetical protein
MGNKEREKKIANLQTRIIMTEPQITVVDNKRSGIVLKRRLAMSLNQQS